MNGRFIRIIVAVILSIAAVVGFITYCVSVPFPACHTLEFLSPLMGPFLRLGESIYQDGARRAVPIAVAAACAGVVLSLMVVARKENRRLSRVLVLPMVTAAVVAELLFGHAPAAVSYALLGAAFALLVIASAAGYREQLKDLIPPPTRRNRMLLLLAVIVLGLVFRAYHLDIRPPGDAHHSAESGIIAAQLAHEFPLDLTSPTKFIKAIREAIAVLVKQESIFDVIAAMHPRYHFEVYHVSMTGAEIGLFLDRVAFNIWGSHFIIQRALSVILGVLTLYVLFLLGEDLFGTSAGLLAAFFMAVSPWHNTHSRYGDIGFAITMLCATLTVLCAVRAIQRRSIGWTLALVLNLAFDFYLYPSTQFAVFVVIAFWLYSMVQNRQSWRSVLIVGLASLAVVALLSAPKTHLLGPLKNIRLINAPINDRVGYSVQSYRAMAVNVVKLAKSLLVEATDNDCWFRKGGAILLWPVSVLFMGGLAWCLPRLSDSRCALLILWFSIGVLPTIPSPYVLARRITCAAPAIYMLAALFASMVLARLRQLFAPGRAVEGKILVSIALALLASSAFATFYYHTMVYEEWSNGDHRRIAEIVYENIREYYLYLDYDAHQIIEPVWIYCEKYLAPGEEDFPLTFFKESEFTQKILPALRTGPEGAMFLVPANGEGNALIESLRALYPGGRYEMHRLDQEYFDHSKGVPLCQSYRIPRGLVAQKVGVKAPQARPEIKRGVAAKGEPLARMPEGKQGSGPGEYKEPRGIALDSKGNVYVADFRNYRIQRFDRLGTFVAAWGEGGEGPGQFKDPCGVAVDRDGRVYVADTFNNRVQVFDGNGKYILHFEGGFYAPRGIAVDEKRRIWVADSGNGVVKLFSGKGEQLKLIGKRGRGKGEFDGPNSIAIDSKGKVYVADAGNRRVQLLDAEGNYVSEFKVDGWQQGIFNEPYLDVDERGDIYLSDPPGNRILKYSQKGKLLGVLKPMEGAEPLLAFPMGIAVEKKGEAIYVVDCQHHRIWKAAKKDFR